ncbi:hypothetical protein LSH36_783g00000 [Paralvinella palmiformis]|uniref:Uncharacterized protein n=1 Tax=Paralvinella palmiformis TaxID=53620 RepID=A0AAD9J1W8_9ANNE|nr:hypothetical protein LSH36_783g00000 [Paralvinella palmiformis]
MERTTVLIMRMKATANLLQQYVNRISSNVHHLVVYLLDGYAMERTTVLIMRMKATANLLQQHPPPPPFHPHHRDHTKDA